MRPTQMTLEGFMSFRHEATINFEGLSSVALTGANGEGKSSIILGIAWIIYGDTRLNGDKDSVINDHTDWASGTLDFVASDGTLWRVKRTRWWRGTSELQAYHFDEESNSWVAYGDHRISTTQDHILSVVGIDEDAFYSLMVVRQSSMAGGTRFTGADSNSRRNILMGLLPELSIWGELESESIGVLQDASQDVKNAEKEVDRLKLQQEQQVEKVADIQGRLEAMGDPVTIEQLIKDLEVREQETRAAIESFDSGRSTLSDQLDRLKTARDLRNSKVQTERERINAQLREVNSIDSRLAKLYGQSDDIKEKREQATEALTKAQSDAHEAVAAVTEAKSSHGNYDEQITELQSQIAVVSGRADEVHSRIEVLNVQSEHDESGECLVCQSKLTHEKVLSLLEDAKQARVTFREEIRELEQFLAEARAAKTRSDRRIQDAESALKQVQARTETLDRDIISMGERLEDLEQQTEALEDDLEALPSHDDLEGKLEQLVDEAITAEEAELINQIEQIDAKSPYSGVLPSIQSEMKLSRDKLLEVSRISGRLEAEQGNLSKTIEDLDRWERDLKSLYSNQETLTFVREACSPKGVPSMLISEILTSIEEKQNQLLERLMGDRAVRVSFAQERELKSREGTKAALDIIVDTPDGFQRPIESFSGGEQVRLTISNLFAMLQVFNERHPGMVSTVFLDEPFGPLDEESIPILIDIVREAIQQGIVQSVFIVSHDPRVQDTLPQKMLVYKDASMDNSSVVEVQ